MKVVSQPDHSLATMDNVQGKTVYDIDGNDIGSINQLLVDQVSGRVIYAVVSFGAALPAGHNHYPLPWSALQYDTEVAGYRTELTARQLQDAPELCDETMERRDWEVRIHDHYGSEPYWLGETGRDG